MPIGTLCEIKRRGENKIISIDSNFLFRTTNIREYFSNFSFNLDDFKFRNRIIPVYDFDLIMELNVEKFDINSSHSHHVGGFIFNHITFKIIEFTFDDKDKTIDHKTLGEIRIFRGGEPKLSIKRLYLKANKEYEFSFFDEVTQRVIESKYEKYDVGIDYRLRFYYYYR